MMKIWKILIASCAFLAMQAGCESQIDDLKSESLQSSVPTTESGGVVTATVDPNKSATILASSTGELADSSITMAAGTLAISTATVQVAMGPATDSSANVASALGFATTAIGGGTSPIFVGGVGQNIATNNPLTISFPLPVTAGDLTLKESTGSLALLYVIYTTAGYKVGIKPLTSSDFSGIFIKTEVAGLGFYRIVYLPTAIAAKEVAATFTPGLSSTK